MKHSQFLEGPFGAGKTTHAIGRIRQWLDAGVPGHHIFVLVPQRTLGMAYQSAFAQPDWPDGSVVDVVTLGGLARRAVELFWPLINQNAGFADPAPEPTFLTVETAQYYMARFVHEEIKSGVFDSLNITPYAIMRQTLDNLSKAAVNQFTLDETAERLIAAWGPRHTSRPTVYRASLDIARQFRNHCLQHSLLDFSLQIELFVHQLLANDTYQSWFRQRFRYMVADNLEENFPVVADFLHWAWDELDEALLLYDTDAGFRMFLGANPRVMYELKTRCDEHTIWSQVIHQPDHMQRVVLNVSNALLGNRTERTTEELDTAFTFSAHKFYPQMIDWVVSNVADLIDAGVAPAQIVVLAPFLGDSLWFALSTRLGERGIPHMSHRPSRAIRAAPAARAVLTLMALAHPTITYRPPVADVADALQQAVDSLDPVRAWLLAQIVYSPARDDLGTFGSIQSSMQERITFLAGNKYDVLRQWLVDYQQDAFATPPDHFVSRLFSEVLSHEGFGFHSDLDAGRTLAELVESARKFRQALYPNVHEIDDWTPITTEYFSLIQEGLLPALYLTGRDLQRKDAVALSPAYTFVMRNQAVDYQFWLDVGSPSWWERLEQPLTHPHVLARDHPKQQVWTDEMEYQARQEALFRLIVGLARRCNRHIYAAISDLGEQGFEQRGPLLRMIQRLHQ